MSTGISAAGLSPFQPGQASNDPELEALYQQILRQGGDPATALAVVKTAEGWFNDMYTNAMVNNVGDEQASLRTAMQHKGRIMELASLIPGITGSNAGQAGQSLNRARALLGQMGVTDMEPFHGYLRANVQSDDALTAAGFDVDAVRSAPESALSHVDKEAVLTILRQLLEGYQAMGHIDAAQVEEYLDQGRAAAEMYGVGSRRVEGSQDAADADQAISVAMLGIPIRA